MRIRRLTAALSLALLLAAFGMASAQESGAAAKEETLTGCLNPAPAEGQFQLSVYEDGKETKKVVAVGPEELGKHASNHTVKLTGSMAKEDGKDVFKVTKIEHVAATCEAATE